MALADFAAYKSALMQFGDFGVQMPAQSATGLLPAMPMWKEVCLDAAPGAAAVPAQNTGLNQADGAGRLTLMGLEGSILTVGSSFSAAADSAVVAWALLYDRLSHQSGLSGTSTSAQTTNLATAALTRYTSGVGVMMAYQIYTTIGSTVTSVTVSYTNEAGTSGRTSLSTPIGGASLLRSAGLVRFMQGQSGDRGVRAIASATLAASTTTAGDWGVFLLRPIALIPLGLGYTADAMSGLIGGMEEILPGACLSMLVTSAAGTQGGSASSVQIQGPILHLADV